MPLTAGTHLGPYEILSPIGKGGMGEVYKANDTRLDRTVAIKVLPEHLAESPERKARFEREAKAISQLNHPHICTLYDVGQQDGIDFIVMEYIEGETLADALKRGALPLDKALEYGIHIADGLDTAHRAGIVHRDLKPGNAMLTKSGVKLLDFGLARLIEEDVGPATSDAPTRQKDLTNEESIIGTLQYMAPEQLERKPADARTDIFALGVVLYEMVTGNKAFTGKSQASLIGAILKDDPPSLSAFSPMSPPALDHVVKTCLAKDPDERCQSAGEVGRNLKWIREAGTDANVPAPTGVTRRGLGRFVDVLLAAALATAVTALVVWALMRPDAPHVSRLAISAPLGQSISMSNRYVDLAISPDGSRIVYVGQIETGGRRLFIRRLDQYEPEALDGTGPDPRNPFFSPDGSWVGYLDTVRPGRLMKVSTLGGPPLAICAASHFAVRGASWGSDDNIIFADRGSLLRVSASGGEPEILADADGLVYSWPDVLPGGKAVLFSATESPDTSRTELLSLQTGEQKTLVRDGSNARYASSGHILYAAQGTVRAMRFDLDRLEVTGTPIPVVERVSMKWSGAANFDVSDDGSLVYIPGSRADLAARRLVWVHRDGLEQPVAIAPAAYGWARVSPDGARLALSLSVEGNRDVWIYKLARGTLSRVTIDPALDNVPFWTPDGERVVFASLREGGRFSFFLKAADGTGQVEKLVTSETDVMFRPFAWSRDGNTLVLDYGAGDIGIVSMEGDKTVQALIQSEAYENSPSISPDGAWIAYSSDQTGEFEIYVERFPELGERQQVSTGGGVEPLWSPNGREIYYRRGDAMIAVPVDQGPPLSLGAPTVLFEGLFYQSPFGGRRYDISPDGTRFLMIKDEATADGAAPVNIHVVLNWTDELERLVPTEN